MKVLILKPSSLGDVVQALPVMRLIKAHRPDSEIYWWIDSRFATLLEGDRDLTGLVRFERQRWARPQYWGELLRSVRWVRAHHFDWVIDLQCLARSGMFAWLANGNLLVGLDEGREGARGFYDVIVPRASFHTHAVDWYLSVLPALGVPRDRDFDWLPPRPAIAAAVRSKWPVTGARWMTLQPGARWENKRWPIEHFRELTRLLAAHDASLRFAILGGNEDRELGARLAGAEPARCLDLTGQCSLPEMVEWIRLSTLMVTNDTGPMHVAAALGTPLLAMFGPTEPRRTGPHGQLGNSLSLPLPCAPCLKSSCRFERPFACLRELSPAIVFEQVRTRLATSSGAPLVE